MRFVIIAIIYKNSCSTRVNAFTVHNIIAVTKKTLKKLINLTFRLRL